MTNLSFSFENFTDHPLDPKFLQDVAEAVCNEELPGGVCEIALVICSDEQIRKYNQRYRGDDSVTDVLCFNGSEDFPKAITEGEQGMSCDILIDIKQLERQKGSKSMNKELMEIFIHGLLHGFGYDHIRAGDCKHMKEKEEHYIKMMEGTQPSG